MTFQTVSPVNLTDRSVVQTWLCGDLQLFTCQGLKHIFWALSLHAPTHGAKSLLFFKFSFFAQGQLSLSAPTLLVLRLCHCDRCRIRTQDHCLSIVCNATNEPPHLPKTLFLFFLECLPQNGQNSSRIHTCRHNTGIQSMVEVNQSHWPVGARRSAI